MENLPWFVTLGIMLIIYFIPTFIAIDRKKKNRWWVVVVNIFLWWTLLWWVLALAMAFWEKE